MDNYVSAFHNARSLTRRMVEDADHAFSQKPAQKAYTAILIKWLAEMIMGAREEVARRVAERVIPEEMTARNGDGRRRRRQAPCPAIRGRRAVRSRSPMARP